MSSSNQFLGWIKFCNSEVRLVFFVPLMFWIFVALAAVALGYFGRDLKLFIALTWCGLGLTATFFLMLPKLVLESFARDFVGQTYSLRRPIADLYSEANSTTGPCRRVLVALCFIKACFLMVGGAALLGGILVIVLWLPELKTA